MIIDAHQHFWTLARGDYPWPNEDVAAIFKDFGPYDLLPLLKENGVTQTVLVQATDTVAETQYLLEVGNKCDVVAGVVGWVDLSAPNAVDVIDDLRIDPMLKGLRPMLQNIDSTDWILGEDVAVALSHMEQVGLRFDALIQPRHLGVVEALAQKFPDLQIVIDHVAKPAMGQGQMPDAKWVSEMNSLANFENVFCKLSGMITEIGPEWVFEDIAPFARHILHCFGPAKTLYGSDWPVVNLAGDYGRWIKVVELLLEPFEAFERDQIMGINAQKFYGLRI
ncbi:amidohydrolase family protein [Shimia sp.]|uniref:amidohydrolase family protein n=1 Tax=Shimia sp. TaxID=1954381 RepID=UPI003B8D0133